jgi:hypothetical protein
MKKKIEKLWHCCPGGDCKLTVGSCQGPLEVWFWELWVGQELFSQGLATSKRRAQAKARDAYAKWQADQ